MKGILHTSEQIIRKLHNVEQLMTQGKTFIDVCLAWEVSQPTDRRCRQLYSVIQALEAKRLAQLEKENGKLKRL